MASIRDRKRKRDRSESGGQIPTGDRVRIDGRTMQPEPPPRRPIHGNLRVSTSWGLASNLFGGVNRLVQHALRRSVDGCRRIFKIKYKPFASSRVVCRPVRQFVTVFLREAIN